MNTGWRTSALSTLAIVGPDGVSGKLVSPLTDHEMELLHKSADSLRTVMNGLTFLKQARPII